MSVGTERTSYITYIIYTVAWQLVLSQFSVQMRSFHLTVFLSVFIFTVILVGFSSSTNLTMYVFSFFFQSWLYRQIIYFKFAFAWSGKSSDQWVNSVTLVYLYFCVLQSGLLFLFINLNYFWSDYNDVCIFWISDTLEEQLFLIEKCWHVSFHCVLNWFNDTSHHFSVYFGNYNYMFV